MRHWLAAALAGVLVAAGFALAPDRALPAYLAAFAFAASVLVGALTLALIGRLTGARWYADAAQGRAEALVATIPLLALFFVPVVFGLARLYPWARTDVGDRSVWLDPLFFVARSVVYIGAWSALAFALPRSPRKTGALGLIAVGFTSNFAAFDWLMSLEPDWSSAIYGVYWWSGGFLAALALVLLLGRSHEAVAKLLLTAAIFWAYVAYSQALIVWIAGIPRENAWYAHRTDGAWSVVAAAVLVAKFVVPFLVLLPHAWKRRRRVQVAASLVVLAGHALDVLWLVLPDFDGALATSALAVAALVALGAFFLGAAQSRKEPVLA